MIVDTDHGTARCVVLGRHDAPAVTALTHAVVAAGYEVTSVVGRWPELLATVVESDADAVVLDLAMAGRSGLRLIAAVRALAPRCRIVVISELRAIDLASIEAGAAAVVDPADLRALTAALRDNGRTPAQG